MKIKNLILAQKVTFPRRNVTFFQQYNTVFILQLYFSFTTFYNLQFLLQLFTTFHPLKFNPRLFFSCYYILLELPLFYLHCMIARQPPSKKLASSPVYDIAFLRDIFARTVSKIAEKYALVIILCKSALTFPVVMPRLFIAR